MPYNEQGTVIRSWSGRELTARKHYTCARCGGSIVSGTKYVRDVVRFPSQSHDTPRANRHYHRDCETPWDQASDHHHLRHLGRLARRDGALIKADVVQPPRCPTIVINVETLGILQWTLPKAMAAAITTAPARIETGVQSEIELAVRLLIHQLLAVTGDERKAKRLSDVLAALTQV